MRVYICKYCDKKSTRKDIRKCLMAHIKTDKKYRKKKYKNSNITETMNEDILLEK